MKRMYAVVKTRGELGAEIKEVEMPKIGSREVLIKVKAAAICGTDVHIWNWDELAQNEIKNFPLIFGHECSGEVVELGRDVKSVKVGDYVSPEGHLADVTCYQCRTGRMHICRNTQGLGVTRNGVFAEYVALPELNVWKNDPDIDPYLASIQDPLGNAVHTALPMNCPEDIAGAYVAVLGCGPVGLMSIAVAKALGASMVIATAGGNNRLRMSMAEKMGADIVLNAKDLGDSIVDRVLEATGGRGADVVFEMSGAESAIKQAFKILTPGGRISLLGFSKKPITLDLNNLLIFKYARVYGIYGRRMFETWYQMKGLLRLSEFRSKITSLITHKLPIKDIAEGMELINSKRAVKVVLEPRWE